MSSDSEQHVQKSCEQKLDSLQNCSPSSTPNSVLTPKLLSTVAELRRRPEGAINKGRVQKSVENSTLAPDPPTHPPSVEKKCCFFFAF